MKPEDQAAFETWSNGKPIWEMSADEIWAAACAHRDAQPAVAVNWLPLETAPKDGTLCRLLVQFVDHATEDKNGPSPTIGFNNLDNDDHDSWRFAGWDWCHDVFVQGTGEAIGWLPLLEPAVAVNERLLCAAKKYFMSYCRDEASEFGPDDTGCSQEQHKDALELGEAIAATEAAKGGE